MKIDEFANKAQTQDNSNLFSKYDGSLDIVPNEILSFYANFISSSVEIGYNGTSIHLIPTENLIKENKYYDSMNIGFVFATCDGDPIFYHEGKVYTCPHGVKNPEWELLAESVEEYFNLIISK